VEIRLLARRSEIGYVTSSFAALRNELPAVSADEQRDLTRRARLGPLERGLEEALREAEYHAAQARAAERRARRLEQRLAKDRTAV
jgi:hypothetical protein